MNTQIEEFFRQYERANADFDVDKIATFYADVFMFGGPQGVQAVKKEDFVKVLPRRKEFFRSVSLVSSKIQRVEPSEIHSKYALVKVIWKMRIERSGSDAVESENSSTYVLCDNGRSFQIVFQIDHQDLAKKIQEMG